ncbi:hypothetical protein ASE61_13360 [Bosea sp. Root670]|jgi:hypothetical protein|uniref:Helix-turn-helix domain-containing protein n=1 Tax=Bosea robiniae TaxID=1036780 RepID=A0ABY0P285_9HYPH|nr:MULTISPECIES: helix-turn-helix domain-containing protein [Bosea]KRE03449.1 hypothetical protein ASE61_13360 [Bosea sp. Root670]TQI75321.1 hypothetical protein FHT98_3100 [Bosea sp. AK1]SDG83501.1 hypothetical protein SAMN05421844_105403 [Bosea robiniae]
MTGPLGTIYSLQEAADHLRISKQALARAARRYGIGSMFGRHHRFTDDDLKAILEAMKIRGEEANPVAVRAAYQSLKKMAQAKRDEKVRQRAAARGGNNGKR